MNFYDTIRYNLYIQFLFLISPFYYSKTKNRFVVPNYFFVTVLIFSSIYLTVTLYLFQSINLKTSREVAATTANLSGQFNANLASLKNSVETLTNTNNLSNVVVNPIVNKKSHNALVAFIGSFEIIITLCSFVLFTLNSYYYKGEHIQFLEMVNKFDVELLYLTNNKNVLQYKVMMQRSLGYTISVLLYYFVLQNFLFMQMFYSEKVLNTIIFLTFYGYAAGLNGFYSLTYTTYIIMLLERFTIVKHSLKRFMESGGQSDDRKSSLDKLYTIFELYKTMASGIDMINNFCGIPCLLVILHDFTLTTTQVYMIFATIADVDTKEKYTVVCAILVWMFPNVVKLSSITYFCHITINSVKRIEELFRWANHHSLKNNDYKYTDEMNKLIEYFSYRKLHYQYKFTANKFVSINATLMFTIVSAITTYLVILIQFKNYEDENS